MSYNISGQEANRIEEGESFMLSNEVIIEILGQAEYSNIMAVSDSEQGYKMFSAVNVLGQERIFRIKQMLTNPIEVYSMRPVNLEFMDFDNMDDIKVLSLEFTDECDGVVNYIVKFHDNFYKLTDSQIQKIENTYDTEI